MVNSAICATRSSDDTSSAFGLFDAALALSVALGLGLLVDLEVDVFVAAADTFPVVVDLKPGPAFACVSCGCGRRVDRVVGIVSSSQMQAFLAFSIPNSTQYPLAV